MLIPGIVVVVGIVMLLVEVRQPGRNWPKVRGWWARALALNAVQAGAVFGAGLLWDSWMHTHRPWTADALGVVGGALLGYFVLTFFYYWWHRARHEVGFLWRWFHQLHHSPQRLEVVTSFYKHPLEIAANALLSSGVMYLIVGLSPAAAAGATLLAGLAELFYHWNVRTPRWLGYLIQRPESHCVHHQHGHHRFNYGDLPLWDMLFGTFHNPATFEGACGFGEDESRLKEMLIGRDVSAAPKQRDTGRQFVLAALGLLAIFGHAVGSPTIKGVAMATAASPAPKVFTTHQGLETFSSSFTLAWVEDGDRKELPLTADNYSRLEGPYNRRNVYGAVLAYGPVLVTNPTTRPMFREVARYALCPERGAVVLEELGVDAERARDVEVRYEFGDSTPTSFPRVIAAPCAAEPT